MRCAPVVAVTLVAVTLLAGCASPGQGGEPEMDAPDEVARVDRSTDHEVELTLTSASAVPVTDEGLAVQGAPCAVLELPPDALLQRATANYTWAARTPLAETLRASVAAIDRDFGTAEEGPSPLTLAFGPREVGGQNRLLLRIRPTGEETALEEQVTLRLHLEFQVPLESARVEPGLWPCPSLT